MLRNSAFPVANDLYEAFNDRLAEVALKIPDSEELVSFDAFCTGDHEWRFEIDDWQEGDRLAWSLRHEAVDRFCAAHPGIDEQFRVLESMARVSEEYDIRVKDSAPLFIELLCRRPNFIAGFICYVLNDPHPRLGFEIRVVLPHLRSANPAYYEQVGVMCARRSAGDVAWGVAHGVCFGQALNRPLSEDAAIISELAGNLDADVRRLAIVGAGRLGRDESFQMQAAEIITAVDIAGQVALADALCEAFGPSGMSAGTLTRDQVRRILDNFVQVPRFSDLDDGVFFSAIATRAPDILFEFFLTRLRRYRELQGSHRGFCHWGVTPPSTYFRDSAPPDGVADQLRSARDCIVADATVPPSWTAELFWVFGDAGGAADIVLQEWLDSGDLAKISIAKYLASCRERSSYIVQRDWGAFSSGEGF